jgi:hypothetical protein
MKKVLIGLLSAVYMYANNFAPIEYTVQNDINKLNVDIPNKHTGVVIKDLGKNKSIIAIAKVNNGSIEYLPNTLLEQEYLPKVTSGVSPNDKIVFNYMYSNSVIIAPNSATYKKIKNRFSDKVNFIDIDTFSGFLNRENEPSPQKDEFIEYAKDYDIGLFYFAIDGRLYMVDARTFEIVYSRNFRVSKENIKLPFYSYTDEIRSSFFDFTENGVKDYTSYYKSLLGI